MHIKSRLCVDMVYKDPVQLDVPEYRRLKEEVPDVLDKEC